MIQFVIKYLLFTCAFIIVSCGQNRLGHIQMTNSDTSDKKVTEKSRTTDTSYWLSPKTLKPFTFLEIMKKKRTTANDFDVIVMIDSFPDNWVRREDIDSLMTLVGSKEKCNCYLNPLSSYIPQDNAEVGGFAIELVSSFRQNKKVSFGLYSCPKTNEKEAEELIRWWAQQKK